MVSASATAIAPMSQIPVEIVSTIFETIHADSSISAIGIEVVLSDVCKDWRAIVLRSPRLWTRILCTRGRLKRGETVLYLQNSHSLPINLSIHLDDFAITRDESFAESHHRESLFRVLSSHFWRINDLLVSCTEDGPLESLLRQLHPITAPFLRSIDIDCWEHPVSNSFPSIDIFTGGAPKLSEVRFGNLSLKHCQPPLASVKAIYCFLDESNSERFDEYSEAWMARLAAATSLNFLQIDAATTVITADWVGRVELPVLQSLCLSAADNFHEFSWERQNILQHAVAPCLEVLMLNNFCYFSPSFEDIRSENFPSLHTVIFWKANMKFINEEDVEGGYKLLLDNFRRPSIKNIICGDISKAGCRHLLFTLALCDSESDAEDAGHYIEGGGGGVEDAGVGDEGHLRQGEDEKGAEDTQHAGAELKRPSYLPDLQTLAIIPSNNGWYYPFPLTAMRRLLVRRKAAGRPIQKVYVTADFLAEVCGEFTSEEGLVQVEVWRPQLLPNGHMWPEGIWHISGDCTRERGFKSEDDMDEEVDVGDEVEGRGERYR
ncbi:hypothetical protein FIBSPDRAFT_247085 [Athelia psychrophila]|uniref:F-box domain-containing protein n=1 Tax=Athelia psychrophila TaxID=1759441 RepID=A0A166RVW9_9AGAM|nr:hypothetical protein FIBSPDRAFT_247085 [Fibularhizoctonia sp. CBS 109695]